MSNRELRITVSDLCIMYGCAAGLMYAVAGVAYYMGSARAKIEVANRLDEIITTKQLTQ